MLLTSGYFVPLLDRKERKSSYNRRCISFCLPSVCDFHLQINIFQRLDQIQIFCWTLFLVGYFHEKNFKSQNISV